MDDLSNGVTLKKQFSRLVKKSFHFRFDHEYVISLYPGEEIYNLFPSFLPDFVMDGLMKEHFSVHHQLKHTVCF